MCLIYASGQIVAEHPAHFSENSTQLSIVHVYGLVMTSTR